MLKRIKKILVSLCVVLGMVSLIGCSNTKEKPDEKALDREELESKFLTSANEVLISDDSVSFKDANDKTFILNKNPKRVCNLYASFTTLWYEAGGVVSGCIGGSSSIDLYKEYIGRDITKDEGVTVLATSSSGSKWSTETILASQPDLIICSTAMSGYKTISAPAEAAGIPCVAVLYNDFSDYLKWFKVFSFLNDKKDLWEEVAVKALNDVVEVILETKDLEGPSVFSMFSGTTKFQANTKNTVVGAMIEELGGKNIVSSWANETDAERLDMNLEAIYAGKPSMILIQCHSGRDEVVLLLEQIYKDNALWNSITENVGEENIFFLEKTLFHNKPNSKFAVAYQTLAKILYPNHSFSF
ncbi:MAG: ABC transporter substrate-binding protein [Roseburia sp.]|nr:ABC transporter substrate-binding protein [Anaeroplasma bactoclasticum]MCM1196133.1 ABC transporter substrate-binding protein [Roseburia sp.]MCM1557130.1 ABC transporter substrate-binding protein [Anaeroplasma bactoclasticum]